MILDKSLDGAIIFRKITGMTWHVGILLMIDDDDNHWPVGNNVGEYNPIIQKLNGVYVFDHNIDRGEYSSRLITLDDFAQNERVYYLHTTHGHPEFSDTQLDLRDMNEVRDMIRDRLYSTSHYNLFSSNCESEAFKIRFLNEFKNGSSQVAAGLTFLSHLGTFLSKFKE